MSRRDRPLAGFPDSLVRFWLSGCPIRVEGKTNQRTREWLLAGNWCSELRTSLGVACKARCQLRSWILTLSMIEVRAGLEVTASIRLDFLVPYFV
jgi:hypothetical protein